jgi:alpha-1,6-mannosyltransferase
MFSEIEHTSPARGASERRVALIGLATASLYAVSWRVQVALFHNGKGWLSTAPSTVLDPTAAILELVSYAVITALLFVCYLAMLRMCQRDQLADRRARLLALMLPCLLNIGLGLTIPHYSLDILSYMAQGATGNPFAFRAETISHTALGAHLLGNGWDVWPGLTPYGIIWTRIEIAIMNVSGSSVFVAMLLIKLVVIAASLSTALLLWKFLGRVRPEAQLLGTVAYLWSPLILSEFAGEGHNDSVMLFLVMGALWACAAQRPTLSWISALLGVLTKYVPLLFCPAQLVLLWRTRRNLVSLVLPLVTALVALGTLAVFLYAPLWVGLHTFDGLARQTIARSSASPYGVIYWLLKRTPLAPLDGLAAKLAAVVPLLIVVVRTSLRVDDVQQFARACMWIAITYVLVALPNWWPWYASLPAMLMFAAEPTRMLWFSVFSSFTARLVAPLEMMRDHHLMIFQVSEGLITGLGQTLPLLVLGIWAYRHRARQGRHSLQASIRGWA